MEKYILALQKVDDRFISKHFYKYLYHIDTDVFGLSKGANRDRYYSSAEKIGAAAQGAIAPIAQAFFPRIAKKIKAEFYILWRKSTIILVSVSVWLVALLFILSQLVYKLLLGSSVYCRYSDILCTVVQHYL